MSDSRSRGLAAAKERKPDEAAQWFRKAIEEQPGDLEARSWLGQSLNALGQRVEGVAHLHQAAEGLLNANPVAPDQLNQALAIAAQLQGWSALDEALALCRRAVAVAPQDARAHHLLAVCCSQMNLPQEALDHIKIAQEGAPDEKMIQVLRGSFEADVGNLEAARPYFDAVLANEPSPLEKFRAHKELARIFDRLGDYDRAFAELAASDAVARDVPEFRRVDWQYVVSTLNANRAAFSPEALGRFTGHDFQDRAAPVFLMGFFRSGMTLTQEVLGSHPDIFVSDENELVRGMVHELNRIDPSPATLAAKAKRLTVDQVARLRAYYWTLARGRYGDAIDKPVFVDKCTMNTLDVAFINIVFPDAKVIFMVRDPRDVCISAHMQLMPLSPATVHLMEWQGTANVYAGVMSWWVHISERLTLPWLEVRYEDAVDAFEATYSEVLSFVGLKWDPALLDFHKHAAGHYISTPSRSQVTQPLYRSSLERWRRYEHHFASVADRVNPFVEAYDY